MQELLAQTVFKPLYGLIGLRFDAETRQWMPDIAPLLTYMNEQV